MKEISSATAEAGPTKTETLFGGVQLSVVIAGDPDPKMIWVKQLSLRECPLLDAAGEDELKEAAVYTDRPVAFIESLERVSQEQIILEGQRLNADFFGRWMQRRLKRQNMRIPGGFEGLIEKALPGILRQLQAAPSSPTSVSTSPLNPA